jgi:hypothetical protein
MRHPDMPFVDEAAAVDLKDGEERRILKEWQDAREPAMTLRVWLSTGDAATLRLDWGTGGSQEDELLALLGAHKTVCALIEKMQELAIALGGVGGARGES